MHVVCDVIDLAVGVFGKVLHNKPYVECGFAPVTGDHKHVVFGGLHLAASYAVRTEGEHFGELLLRGTWFYIFDDCGAAD